MLSKLPNKTTGFTLVEVIVSMSIFAVAVTMVMVGLLSVLDSSKQARAQADAVDNLNFVVDDMIRRIRTGYAFNCAGMGDCPAGADRFSFTSSEVDNDVGSNPRVTYELGTTLDGNGQIQRTISTDGNTVPMTSPDINVTNLTFYTVGTRTGDNEQSRVMILIEAEAGAGDLLETFSLQTTVTQRLLFNP
ncbi:MAG: type II secretion system protein [Candidatus Paceibacterota bacterium]